MKQLKNWEIGLASIVALAMLTGGTTLRATSLFVANEGNNSIVELTPTTGGGASASVFASGNGLSVPAGLAFDRSGNLFVANYGNDTISKITPDGTVSLFASNPPPAPSVGFLEYPLGLAFNGNGNLLITDFLSSMVVQITPAGSQSLFTLGSMKAVVDNPSGLALDSHGNVYVANIEATYIPNIAEFSPSGGAIGTPDWGTDLRKPEGLAFDKSGNLFIANDQNSSIAEISASGLVSTFISGHGLDNPMGLAFDSSGNLFVANNGDGMISEITPNGSVSTYASGLNEPTFIAFSPTAVPEPATWGLLALGVLPLIKRRVARERSQRGADHSRSQCTISEA